jgi:hypothetical protein
MKKILNFLLRIAYGKKTISLSDFANSVADIATKYERNHWKVEVSMDGFGKTLFSAYVSGHWTRDHNTPEEAIDALIKFQTGVSEKNLIEEVFVNNTNLTTP